MNQIWLAFLTGLTTGGISCLAVQGGLLASTMAPNGEVERTKKQKFQAVTAFLGSKLLVYTILGAALGALGSAVVITPTAQGWFQILAGIFMLLTVGRLLDIHPIFRNFVIQPPRWAYRVIKTQSKDDSIFAPVILGALTLLIPCGVTQAMMILAVSAGSPILGAAIMFAFTLGTSPVFFTLGVAALEALKRKNIRYIASFVIFILGVMAINTGQILRGSSHTLQNYQKALLASNSTKSAANAIYAKKIEGGKQEVTITVSTTGYKASADTLRLNVPARVILKSQGAQGCARAFTIPSLNLQQIVPVTGEEVLEFTPTKAGKLGFSCSMGMYTGTFNVI